MMPFIAMLTMLIDHVGLIFFPHNEMFRIVGRIAFPLYCWFLVQGYRYTSDHKRYMRRLFWLACISQVPYSLAFREWYELNVIFTLLLSLICLYAVERLPQAGYRIAFAAAVLALAWYVPMDYGAYGVLLVLIYRYLDQWKMIAGHMALNALYLAIEGPGYWLQLFSILGTLLVAYPLPIPSGAGRRWLYRSFYPAHLAVLYVVYLLLAEPGS